MKILVIFLIIPLLSIHASEVKNSEFLVNIFATRGANTVQGYGTIIDHQTIITAANLVYQYYNVTACLGTQECCPQDPENCLVPTEVYIHQTFINDYKNGDKAIPLALLKFRPFTFRNDQIVSLDLSDICKCETYIGHVGTTYECYKGGISETVVNIVDHSYTAFKYNYPNPIWPYYFVLPKSKPYTCIGLPGAPLFVDGKLIAINSFCSPQCDDPSYTGFYCLLYREEQIQNYKRYFEELEVANGELKKLTLQEKLNIQRAFNPFGCRPSCRYEGAEC